MQTVSFIKTADISEKINALFESEKQKLHELLDYFLWLAILVNTIAVRRQRLPKGSRKH